MDGKRGLALVVAGLLSGCSSPAYDYIPPERTCSAPENVRPPYAQIQYYENWGIWKIFKYCSVEEGFFEKVEDICEKTEIHAMALLSVMYSESKLNPKAQGQGTATGLLQFLEGTARELGTTTQDIAQMSQVEQLDVVQAYFALWKKRKPDIDFTQPENVALAVFAPAHLGKPLDTAYGRKTGTPLERAIYKGNAALDANRDGILTLGEYVTQALGEGFVNL